jgi:hypothetical protein
VEKWAEEEAKLIRQRYYLGNIIWTMDTADDEMFKREVEKMGIKCSIMKYDDELNI